MRIDIHVHTTFSPCSSLTPEEILRNALNRGLDGVCLTDHGTMEAARHIKPGRQKDGLIVLVGMEYSTDEGDFLIFGPYEDIDMELSARDLLCHVRETGGAAVAAHPAREERPVDESLFRQGLCPLAERINGRNSGNENAAMDYIMETYSLKECGGSDAHSLEELGKVVTFFPGLILSLDDLIQALNTGKGEAQWNVPEEIILL